MGTCTFDDQIMKKNPIFMLPFKTGPDRVLVLPALRLPDFSDVDLSSFFSKIARLLMDFFKFFL